MTFVYDINNIFLYIYILLRSDSMCGIYGITDKNKNWITSYIKKCHYRGPDMSISKNAQVRRGCGLAESRMDEWIKK